MKLIVSYIDWFQEWDNAPRLCAVVDSFPREGFVYEERGGIYWAQVDELVSFFFYEKPGDGFGGSRYELTMKDGSTKILIGPWSSSTDAANAQGFPPSVDVVIYEANGRFPDLGYACHITVDFARKCCQKARGYLVQDGTGYYPSLHPDIVLKPRIAHYMAYGDKPERWSVGLKVMRGNLSAKLDVSNEFQRVQQEMRETAVPRKVSPELSSEQLHVLG
jgi:hypothetical protein